MKHGIPAMAWSGGNTGGGGGGFKYHVFYGKSDVISF